MSTATVSRTMSGQGPVSEATRTRVLRVAERLSYQPSAAARSLRTRRTMIIGVLVPDLANPVWLAFLRGVEHVAESHGYAVLVVDARRSAAVERRALGRLRAQGVDALVHAGPVGPSTQFAELRGAGIVVVDAGLGASGQRSLIADLERPATIAMCDALAERGHRRVAYVSREPVVGPAGRRRLQAIRERCQELGVGVDHHSLQRAQAPTDVAALLRRALHGPRPVTAVVCGSHGLAPGVLRGLRIAGVELPRDCSLVTYGDSDWAEAYRPAISVVTLDLHQVGVAMATETVAALAGEPLANAGSRLDPARFLERESVGAPASC